MAKSPINGVPTPRGKPFTSESAREARRKRTEKEYREKSITKAFQKMLTESFQCEDGSWKTGAEVLAESIIRGAVKGNAKMVELALDMNGEAPKSNAALGDGLLAALIDGLKEPDDIHTETTRTDADMAEE